ncbi:hypothetical protein P3G55_12725 [Leptospira sp. 96542]|nr:hypothetical protein [Leptospira sp. 96542]
MVPNLKKIFLFIIVLFFSHCISDAKKNLSNLKNCKLNLVTVRAVLVPNPNFPIFPNIELYPLVSIENPNESAVTVYEFDLDVYLITNDKTDFIGKLSQSEEIIIESGATKQIELKLISDAKGGIQQKILQLGMQILGSNRNSVEFELKGVVNVQSSVGKIPVPVSERTKIKLKK